MSSPFRIELAREDEARVLAGLIIPAFAHDPIEKARGNVDTSEAIEAASKRHLQAWNEHMEETGRPCAIKCIHADAATGKETFVACAEWFIFDKPRSPEDVKKPHYLLSADWLPDVDPLKETSKRAMKPVFDARAKWLTGRGHAILMYMATDKAWRKQGAATACVQWGIDRCKELGIPAYLEASEDGAPVYKRLGFEVMEDVHVEFDGQDAVFPAMIWWPPGTKDDDKKPLTGQW